MLRQLLGLVEVLGAIAEGLLESEGIVLVDLKGEVAGLAVEGRVGCDAGTFGVVEDDGVVAVDDAGVEPGEAGAA